MLCEELFSFLGYKYFCTDSFDQVGKRLNKKAS